MANDSKKTTDRIRQIKKNVSREVEQALANCALIVERDAKINAPVDTGRLRQSINHETENFGSENPAVTIGTNTEYAKFQEYGSSKFPAQPFLFPAYNNNKRRILSELAKAFKKGAGL